MRLILCALLALAGAGCQKRNEPEPASQSGTAPPHPRPVPANSSRVVAEILDVRELPEGSRPVLRFPNRGPALEARYSIRVEVLEVSPGPDGSRSLARKALTVEALTAEKPPPDAVGRKVEAVMRMTGDTTKVQWWISRMEWQKEAPESQPHQQAGLTANI